MEYQIKACKDIRITGLGLQVHWVEDDAEAEYFGVYFPDSEGKMMWHSDHPTREEAQKEIEVVLKERKSEYPPEVQILISQLTSAARGEYLEMTTKMFAKEVLADWDKNRA
ncbi:hypothetical protein PQC38_gp077 [Aeromonas phage BUCT695]|uniref:hypothetical protein n=1 Tax=Aeromonas phage BUCT695 TaxID=2908630 RepID=UPI002329026C|nr:hypothetical protein PQC38_gp077 [Aeromonas phage BUCT695]UIW10553.1 hypothetical protein [Aeromonas phage BUCT695]